MNEILKYMLAATKDPNQQILKLLFINHRNFPNFKSIGGALPLCFIECEEYDDKIEDAFVTVKNEVIPKIEDFMNLGNNLQKTFDFKSLNEYSNLAELLAKKEKFLSEKRVDLIPFFDQKIKNILIALLAEPLIENWKNQHELLRDKVLLNELKEINGIKKWLGIIICSKCIDFQLIVGDIQSSTNQCPRGHIRCEINIYQLDEEYSNSKFLDNDLSIFIAEYIKSKTDNILQAQPNKDFGIAEIDCYLQESKLGVECKQYLHDLALNQDITRVKGDLTKKMIRYKKAGIKRVILVTNFSDHNQSRLKKEIIAELKKQNMDFESFEWVNTPASLLKQLDIEIDQASKII